MILLHGIYHQVTFFIELDADVLDVLVPKLSHQRLKLIAFGRTVGVIVKSYIVLFPVARSIKDVENLFSRTQSPVLVEALSLSADDIFRKITTSVSLDSRNKLLELCDIVCKLMNSKPLILRILMISVSHKADSDLEISVGAVNDILYNLLKSGFGSLDPTSHGCGAVEEETNLEYLLSILGGLNGLGDWSSFLWGWSSFLDFFGCCLF